MQINFDTLREAIRKNFNDLVEVAQESQFRYDEEKLLVEPHSLEMALADLRENIVTLISIINPETGKIIEGDISNFDLASIEVES